VTTASKAVAREREMNVTSKGRRVIGFFSKRGERGRFISTTNRTLVIWKPYPETAPGVKRVFLKTHKTVVHGPSPSENP
jgi:hypothetical protein